MTLGQKIKAARLERGMTQKQLVGDQITRNMLSKIENDSATPSVRTLEYLARRLGLPAGSFLNDLLSAPDEIPDGLGQMRQAFREGRYLDCMRLLDEDREACATDEGFLLRAKSAAEAARSALQARDYEAAKQYADDADYYNKQGLYYSADMDAEMSLLLAQCALELDTEEYEENAKEFRRAAAAIRFEPRFVLLEAEFAMRMGDNEKAGRILESLTEQDLLSSARYAWLRGVLDLEAGELDRAKEELCSAEQRCESADAGLLRRIYVALQQVYDRLEDYRMAYHYASLQLKG